MLIRFAEVDGVATRYLSAGPEDAPTLLLVHGLTLTCDIWAPVIDLLARDRQVVAPDMLGHGFTRPQQPAAQIDIAAKAAHLARFIQTTTKGHQFDVAGSSYGALVACNLYLREPSTVERLVLIGSGSCFNDETQLAKAIDRAHASYAGLMTASSPDGWREHLAGSVYDRASIPASLPYLLGTVYAQPWIRDYWYETIASMSDPVRFRPFRVLERLDRIRAPTLVVWGLDDQGAPVASARRAVEVMPHATLATLEHCGHFPMFEQPAAASDIVSRFLSSDTSTS